VTDTDSHEDGKAGSSDVSGVRSKTTVLTAESVGLAGGRDAAVDPAKVKTSFVFETPQTDLGVSVDSTAHQKNGSGAGKKDSGTSALKDVVEKQAEMIKTLKLRMKHMKQQHMAITGKPLKNDSKFKKELQTKTAEALKAKIQVILTRKELPSAKNNQKIAELNALLAETTNEMLRKTIANKIKMLQRVGTPSDDVTKVLGPTTLHAKVDALLSPVASSENEANAAEEKAEQAREKATASKRNAKHAEEELTQLSSQLEDAQRAVTQRSKALETATKKYQVEDSKSEADLKHALQKTQNSVVKAKEKESSADLQNTDAQKALQRAQAQAKIAARNLKHAKEAVKHTKEIHVKQQKGGKMVEGRIKADKNVVKELHAKTKAARLHVASMKKKMQEQAKMASAQTESEERSVKTSEAKSEEARRAKATKEAANEANEKQSQMAQVQMYHTAADVANQKATALEMKHTNELGEQAARDISIARAEARVNRKKANRASILLQRMSSDASLHSLRAQMKMIAKPLKLDTMGQPDPEEETETKVDNWYANFKAASNAKERATHDADAADAAVDQAASVKDQSVLKLAESHLRHNIAEESNEELGQSDSDSDDDDDLGESNSFTSTPTAVVDTEALDDDVMAAEGAEDQRERNALDSLHP